MDYTGVGLDGYDSMGISYYNFKYCFKSSSNLFFRHENVIEFKTARMMQSTVKSKENHYLICRCKQTGVKLCRSVNKCWI